MTTTPVTAANLIDGGWTEDTATGSRQKNCMTLLSDPRTHSRLPLDDQRLFDRLLPWTRTLTEASLRDSELADRWQEHRERLIQPNSLFGGQGIVAGWEVDERRCWQAVQDRVAAGAIVQERVVPRAEPVVNGATGEPEPWEANWRVLAVVSDLAERTQSHVAAVFVHPDRPTGDTPAGEAGGRR